MIPRIAMQAVFLSLSLFRHKSPPQLLSNPILRLVRRSAGSIGARSAPSTPLQAAPDAPQAGGQQSISGSQLTVAGASYPPPPRSPSHAALKCNDR